MDLWIRSQDREILTSASYVSYSNSNTTYDTETDEQTTIKGHFIVATSWIVAEYPTKERALEVLDEIQEKVLFGGTIISNVRNGEGTIIDTKYTKTDNIVYNMPKV